MTLARTEPEQPPEDDREDMPSVKQYFKVQMELRRAKEKILESFGYNFKTLDQLQDEALEELLDNRMVSYGSGDYQLAIHYKPIIANGKIIEVADSLRLHQRSKPKKQ